MEVTTYYLTTKKGAVFMGQRLFYDDYKLHENSID